MADCAEDDVDGVTVFSLEVILFEKAILLHVTDDRFDGVPPGQLALDCR